MRKRLRKEIIFDRIFYGICLFIIFFSLTILAYFYFTLQEFYGFPMILYSLLIIIGIIGIRLYNRHQ